MMVTYAEALEAVLAAADARTPKCEVERVPLGEAAGRVLAEGVCALDDAPRFDNSAMDGFLVCCADVSAASAETQSVLPVTGCIKAGGGVLAAMRRAECVEIMTGAPIPPGAGDTVVPYEDVAETAAADGQRFIRLSSVPKKGQHVRRRGEDFVAGKVLMTAGSRVRAAHLPLLAAAGVAQVSIFRRARAVILSTGDELAPADASVLEPGMVRNSSLPYLHQALVELGCDIVAELSVADSSASAEESLRAALRSRANIIVATGGVSAGRFDLLAPALAASGFSVLVHKVAQRPGKPLLFAAHAAGPVCFGLPGNPVASMVGMRFYAAPYLRRLHRRPTERPLRLRLASPVSKPAGLRCFFKGRLTPAAGGEGLTAEVLPGQASFMLSPFAAANSWIVLPEAPACVEAGAVVEVFSVEMEELCA